MSPFEGKAPGLEGIRARAPQRAAAVPAGNLVHHRESQGVTTLAS